MLHNKELPEWLQREAEEVERERRTAAREALLLGLAAGGFIISLSLFLLSRAGLI
jgi:hypothetical protein